jgi:hypothetical protein
MGEYIYINPGIIVTLYGNYPILINCCLGGRIKNSTVIANFKLYFYFDNQHVTPHLLKNHALCSPISQARYDPYQILFYNALLVSRRRLK